MDSLNMIVTLFKATKLKARDKSDKRSVVIHKPEVGLIYEYDMETAELSSDFMQREWEIFKEERVNFSEAFKAYRKGKMIKSLLSQKEYLWGSLCSTIGEPSDEEIDGEWVIID